MRAPGPVDCLGSRGIPQARGVVPSTTQEERARGFEAGPPPEARGRSPAFPSFPREKTQVVRLLQEIQLGRGDHGPGVEEARAAGALQGAVHIPCQGHGHEVRVPGRAEEAQLVAGTGPEIEIQEGAATAGAEVHLLGEEVVPVVQVAVHDGAVSDEATEGLPSSRRAEGGSFHHQFGRW